MINSNSIPQFPESYWIDSTTDLPSYPKLEQDIETDIAVVGGGICGITTAYLLALEGFKVVLLEAGRLLNGTTGHTSAKITAQHDLIYDDLINREGKEKAALYYGASNEALQTIKKWIDQHQIDCGFSVQDSYVYTNSVDYIKKLENEMSAYNALGISGGILEQIPLDVPAKKAIVMKNQAQFHPLHYLSTLVRLFTEAGGQIYEQTTVGDVEEGPIPRVITMKNHRITCKHVVSCTHFPFYDGMGFYFARLYADRSYVLGIKAAEKYPGGMYLSAEDPKRSIRYTEMSDQSQLLIIGGQSHKTGQGVCTINHYEELQRFAEKHFKLEEIAYRWSAQDLSTGDDIPYIGRITASSPNVFVATGFRKWGMTNSTAAALLIRDQIIEKENPYEALFSPSRPVTFSTIKNLIVENADVAKHLIAGKLQMVYKKPEDLNKDEGSVVTLNGRRAGAYKDKEGQLFLVDTTCTHMGCEVEWNDGERTWDCPCHGSRFSISGEVVNGPAEKPLKQLT